MRQDFNNMDAVETETETVAVPTVDTQSSEELSPPWQVIVLNDPVNLMSFVTLIIRRVFGYSEQKATTLMLDVHEKGRAIVWTGEREKAEMYVQQLQGFQLLAKMEKISD
ncbi:MAG: ATP-dependent Clp protease adaptor protein ClpS [Pseudoalteromonas tetraodonis]|jgi:ATP-dependent Clp protease adaptor protein ClpS